MPILDVLGLVDGLVANHLASSRRAGGLAAPLPGAANITGPVRQMTSNDTLYLDT